MNKDNKEKRKIHPVVRFNYFPRIIGMFLLLLILASILYESRNYLLFAYILFVTLIWPHLAYFHGKFSKNSKKAETINLSIDAFTAGTALVIVEFRLDPGLALFLVPLINMITTWGPLHLVHGVVLISAGVSVAGFLIGFEFNQDTTIVTTIMSFSVIVGYSFLLAFLNFNIAKKLNRSKKSLEQANEELRETKDKLWSEMELAQRIQTVLLPEKPEIKGYEIDAYMAPADEVGGDYYDIINVGGVNWLVIGDVSGHGVPAGLIMMMVQTSIRSTLEQNPSVDPSTLLTLVNKTISSNIKQLNEDKYMTITVMAAIKDGTFTFSGLHQDILIFRTETGKIEEVETEGMWIGLLDDIQDMLNDRTLKLNIGDAMLLYTDGIPESWKKGSVKDHRDPETEMYGDIRLKNMFQHSGNLPVKKITQHILESMKEYVPIDDITIVAVKRVE